MKEDVGMSKPKKHANKFRWDPNLTKHFHISTALCIFLYMYLCSMEVVC